MKKIWIKNNLFWIIVLLAISLVFAVDISNIGGKTATETDLGAVGGVNSENIGSISGITFLHCTDIGVCYECIAGDPSMPADDVDCGVIDCDNLNYYWTSGSASVTGINYCKYADYPDITTNRCEALSDCKDANTADCAEPPPSSTVASCGICEYASGACSSCYDYSVGTDSGTCRECTGSNGGEQMSTDDAACGTISCSSYDYYYTSGSVSVTGTNYCRFFDYADITSNRCEGIGNCKESSDCDDPGDTTTSDNVVDTCGLCEYASGACSSCYDYSVGTDSGLCSECTGSNGGEQMDNDDPGCGAIDCDGLDDTYESGSDSASSTNYCYFDDFDDLTSNRCVSLGTCKTANDPATCTNHDESTLATCGICSYVSTCASGSGNCGSYTSGETCGTNKQCDSGANCDSSDGQSCTLDSACYSGYCDNDGQGLADDNHCYTPYNTYFDGEENTKCEYDTGNTDIAADERSILTVVSGGTDGCPSGSECLVANSPACQVYDRDATISMCEYGTSNEWTTTTTGNAEVDTTGCTEGVTCGDGIASNGFCCGDDIESWNVPTYENMDGTVDSTGTCCASPGYCSYGGECYLGTGADIDGDGDQDFCNTPEWKDCVYSYNFVESCGSTEYCDTDDDCHACASPIYVQSLTASCGGNSYTLADNTCYGSTGLALGNAGCLRTTPTSSVIGTWGWVLDDHEAECDGTGTVVCEEIDASYCGLADSWRGTSDCYRKFTI